MDPIVYDITKQQDVDVASTKLETLGFSIDELTQDQIDYTTDYTSGTE
jgi:adenosylhomocysteinase